MGATSGMFGLAGGASGSGFEGPTSGGGAINPFDASAPAQIGTSYTQNMDALNSQQNLLSALQAQHGIQNQGQVYNQLQGVVNGTGPNPAQAMLNQQTGTNVANQAALMAGQRGAGANVGLLARQIAQQGANTQQQAVGQGATMQANQSLNALSNAGTIAGNQVSNEMGATNTNTQARQNEQQTLLNSLAGYNSTNAGLQSNINSANSSLANTSIQGQQQTIGGLFKAGAMALAGAQGGMVQKFDSGGSVRGSVGPQSSFVQHLDANPQMPNWAGSPDAPAKPASSNPLSGLMGSSGGGGGADAEAAPVAAAQGGMAHDYRVGGNVKAKNPGEKAVVHGNSYANDKIPAVLSEGEVVIPRDIMQSKDPIDGAAKFVAEMMKRKKKA